MNIFTLSDLVEVVVLTLENEEIVLAISSLHPFAFVLAKSVDESFVLVILIGAIVKDFVNR